MLPGLSGGEVIGARDWDHQRDRSQATLLTSNRVERGAQPWITSATVRPSSAEACQTWSCHPFVSRIASLKLCRDERRRETEMGYVPGDCLLQPSREQPQVAHQLLLSSSDLFASLLIDQYPPRRCPREHFDLHIALDAPSVQKAVLIPALRPPPHPQCRPSLRRRCDAKRSKVDRTLSRIGRGAWGGVGIDERFRRQPMIGVAEGAGQVLGLLRRWYRRPRLKFSSLHRSISTRTASSNSVPYSRIP